MENNQKTEIELPGEWIIKKVLGLPLRRWVTISRNCMKKAAIAFSPLPGRRFPMSKTESVPICALQEMYFGMARFAMRQSVPNISAEYWRLREPSMDAVTMRSHSSMPSRPCHHRN